MSSPCCALGTITSAHQRPQPCLQTPPHPSCSGEFLLLGFSCSTSTDFPVSLPPKVQHFRALQRFPWKRKQGSALPGDICAPKTQPGAAELPPNQGQTSQGCEDAANNIHQRRNPDFFNPSCPSFLHHKGREEGDTRYSHPTPIFFTYLHCAFVLAHQTLPGCSRLSAPSQLQ